MARDLHDHFFRLAKREGYRSRAAYKLTEIDDRRRVLRAGDRVLDCGAAPGSWLQVASKRVGAKGRVVGIDLSEIDPMPNTPNVHLIQGDFRSVDPSAYLEPIGGASALFDVLLSDMAPSTTGDRTIDHHQSVRLVAAVFDACPRLLRRGGHAVAKVFEGEAYPDLLGQFRARFGEVKGFRPQASRDASTEMFIVAKGFRGAIHDGAPADTAAHTPKPPRRPSTGWGRHDT